MADRHKTTPKAVRMPDGLLAWYEQHAKATDRAVNAALVAALEEYRARREGGSTASAATVKKGSTTRKPKAVLAVPFVAAEDARPQLAPRKHAVNCKCMMCKPKTGGQ